VDSSGLGVGRHAATLSATGGGSGNPVVFSLRLLVPTTGHCKLRIPAVVSHDAGPETEALVERYCADCTSLTKWEAKTEVSPEFDVLLATESSWDKTAIMAAEIAPATRGRTMTTTSSSTRVNPSSRS
jgi:hypothetical protein